MKLASESDDVTAEINVTPFVDVVLVLLVIFMLTTQFMGPSAIDLKLPRAASGGEVVAKTLNLSLQASGATFLDGVPIERAALSTELQSAVQRAPDVQVAIAADRSVDYGSVISLIDLVKSHGIDDFALQIDRQ